MNVIWLKNILKIGGVEEFVFQIVKNYNYNTVVYYQTGDASQIARLKKYCKVRKWEGERVKCDTFISNYDITMVDFVDAKDYIQVIHACYKTQRLEPHLHKKFRYVAVSKSVQKEFEEITGIKPILCYNPLELSEDETTPAVVIGSFTRLSSEKGADIIDKIAERLDLENIKFIWLVWGDSSINFKSPNVHLLKPQTGITNYMAAMDIVAQTSYSEGYSYTVNQAKAMGKKLLYTPCLSFFEMAIDENDIKVEFDLSNIDDVVNKIKKLKKPIKVEKIRTSIWDELLNKEPSNYKGEVKMKVKCTTCFNDLVENTLRQVGDEFEVEEDRFEKLKSLNLVEEVKNAVREEEVKRTVKKTTRKTR